MIRSDQYRKYFLYLCVNHPELVHSVNEKVFETVNVDEALGDFRTSVQKKGFIFRLIDYTYQISDNEAADPQKKVNGAFIVAHHFSLRTGGKDSYNEAKDKSEKIADDVIKRIVADSQNGHPLFYHSLDTARNINVTPIANTGDAGYVGWIVDFFFNNHFPICPDQNIDPAWIDGGTTPHQL